MNEVNTVSTNLNHFREFVCQKLFDIVRKKNPRPALKQTVTKPVCNTDHQSCSVQRSIAEWNGNFCCKQIESFVWIKETLPST